MRRARAHRGREREATRARVDVVDGEPRLETKRDDADLIVRDGLEERPRAWRKVGAALQQPAKEPRVPARRGEHQRRAPELEMGAASERLGRAIDVTVDAGAAQRFVGAREWFGPAHGGGG